MVTHDPEEALYMGDRIALMERGRIVQHGTPDALYTRPENAMVAAFLGEINRLPGHVSGGRVGTPFGPLPAPAMIDGTAVDVLLRTEGLRLHPPADHLPVATVTAVRRLGPLSQVRLALPATAASSPGAPAYPSDVPLTAHVLGAATHRAGVRIGVTLDESLAFVFVADS